MATTDNSVVTADTAKAAAMPSAPVKVAFPPVAPVAVEKVASKASVKPTAKKAATVAKAPVKISVKTPVKAAVKTVAKGPVKTSLKVTKKAAAKAPIKATVKPLTKPKVDKPVKLKKPKLVRDSFTIPKAEYTVLDDLKQRATKLASAVKKSELIRAGVKALAAMSDAAFQAALKAVPTIKTGRPSKTKAD
ncbi:hypothetical protein [Rhodoferax ferrireducens]|uniref:hypothetical protein n=1 Tax=Rhodoferax ferrireducens TaxID=192843 RepID=UPI001E2FF941|nr:hypothetical protein [Rhodoferax ferrireducens]